MAKPLGKKPTFGRSGRLKWGKFDYRYVVFELEDMPGECASIAGTGGRWVSGRGRTEGFVALSCHAEGFSEPRVRAIVELYTEKVRY